MSNSSKNENPPVPKPVSSTDVDEPPIKRARTTFDIVSESLHQLNFTGSSLADPINIGGSSQLPPHFFSFACSFKYAWQLKFAIQGLSDPALNPQRLLRIDVDVSGFNVTVQNWVDKDFGHVCLKPSDFECSEPIEGKIVKLPELSRELRNVNDSSPLYMFHVSGCKDLSFYTFGIIPVIGISIRLLENNDENDQIPKFPERDRTCEAAVLPDDYLTMLQYLLQWSPYQVLVEIMDNTATLTTGHPEDTWKKDCTMYTAPGRQGTEPGKSYRAMFKWGYDDWLNNAVLRDTALAVSLYTEQPTYIVLRFFIENFGYLEYMREPVP
ncbi:uncharacterized protein LOC141649827 [Silene latifolia]|uniref:uncharacterized protein LOC141649827 n=1 Tax=Silene latifolia TaxID=37657 RepID=UPI003D76B550